MGDVKALPGFSIPNDVAPIARVVEILDDALTLAKRGEIIGVTVIAVYRQPLSFGVDYHGEQTSRHTLAAGVLTASYQIGKALSDND
jgi:hypothetical protein